MLTKKLEEAAAILGQIKQRLQLKSNDEIVQKIEENQKRLTKTEKFVNALGQLAKELEISSDLGNIFQSNGSSLSDVLVKNNQDSFKDPKFL